MHQLSVLHRSPQGSLSKDLAEEILRRSTFGKVAVVTNRPVILLSATKKQWAKLIRHVQRERSSTLNAVTIADLTQQLSWMQSLCFTAKAPLDLLEADVTFATAEAFVRTPPICQTLCVIYRFEKVKLHMLTSWMPRNSLVVIYG
jgi:hypothetical protein